MKGVAQTRETYREKGRKNVGKQKSEKEKIKKKITTKINFFNLILLIRFPRVFATWPEWPKVSSDTEIHPKGYAHCTRFELALSWRLRHPLQNMSCEKCENHLTPLANPSRALLNHSAGILIVRWHIAHNMRSQRLCRLWEMRKGFRQLLLHFIFSRKGRGSVNEWCND